MVRVLGRILSPPNIQYKGENLGTSEGAWNLRDERKLRTCKPLERWGYLAINSFRAYTGRILRNDNKQLGHSMKVLLDVLRSLGIQARGENWSKTLDLAGPKDKLLAGMIDEAARNKLKILFVILPEKDTGMFNVVKKLADVACGVPTICVVGKNDRFYKSGKLEQYCANVALKVNLKLGGTNHALVDPSTPNAKRVAIISENKTMVVGIDVTHPGPGKANPSIAAMVASIDADLAQWPADLKVQIRTRQEIVTLLGVMLKGRLLVWKKHHDDYPENILVYRDGVSESQYKEVLESEFNLMTEACKDVYAQANQQPPRFSLIIVGKRHHTRFFPQTGSPARDVKTGNPRCGLVVDRGITEARKWDFFLQSHHSHLGTARPSHYVVLWDEIFTNPSLQSSIRPADLLEQVTHDMCYLFGRATKAVSLCPPVYYADVACERAGRYLADKSDESESGRSEGEMTAAERERLRQTLQKEIEIHRNLKESMFYI